MLVLSRKVGETIVIGPGIEVTVLDICGSRTRIGVEAPQHIRIRRMEIPPTDSAKDAPPSQEPAQRPLPLPAAAPHLRRRRRELSSRPCIESETAA